MAVIVAVAVAVAFEVAVTVLVPPELNVVLEGQAIEDSVQNRDNARNCK
jgi:hypothetical protein